MNPFLAVRNFFVIFRSLWALFVVWMLAVFSIGLALSVLRPELQIVDSIYAAFSTALTLGTPNMSLFQGAFRLLELLLDFFGVILWGIFTSITMKAIEGAYE